MRYLLIQRSVHQKTLGEVADIINSFKENRTNLYVENMQDPFTKALYATDVTYLPKEDFSYDLISHEDEMNIFVEFLKSKNSFSKLRELIQILELQGVLFQHTT